MCSSSRVNNEILGETTTDANGEVDFAPGLARGDGGRAPQLLVAQTRPATTPSSMSASRASI